MRSYREDVDPYIENFIEVRIPAEKVARIKEFVSAVIREKQGEEHHQIDGHNEYKRFYTGTLGEAAIEELLGVDLIDWGIGNSQIYNEADLRSIGLNVGVKTVEYGKYPVIHVKPKRPELILIKKNENTVYICGLASKKLMAECQDISLILSPSLRARGTKTGFYGFDSLVRVENIGVLKIILQMKKKIGRN